jgi:hypothetical protein
MNQKFDEIKLLFRSLYHEPFPSERGKETLGIDLVVLDCSLMGLASNYIGNHGILNAGQKILLSQCIFELNKILLTSRKHTTMFVRDFSEQVRRNDGHYGEYSVALCATTIPLSCPSFRRVKRGEISVNHICKLIIRFNT